MKDSPKISQELREKYPNVTKQLEQDSQPPAPMDLRKADVGGPTVFDHVLWLGEVIFKKPNAYWFFGTVYVIFMWYAATHNAKWWGAPYYALFFMTIFIFGSGFLAFAAMLAGDFSEEICKRFLAKYYCNRFYQTVQYVLSWLLWIPCLYLLDFGYNPIMGR